VNATFSAGMALTRDSVKPSSARYTLFANEDNFWAMRIMKIFFLAFAVLLLFGRYGLLPGSKDDDNNPREYHNPSP